MLCPHRCCAVADYHDYLDPDATQDADLGEIDRFLDGDFELDACRLREKIRLWAQRIQHTQNRIEQLQETFNGQIKQDETRIDELEAEWDDLKNEGYQPPAEEERLNQLQRQIHDLKSEISDTEHRKQDDLTSLQQHLEQLQAEKQYYESQLRRVEHEWDILGDILDD